MWCKVFLYISLISITACSTATQTATTIKHDGPPDFHIDISQIANAIPQPEPLATRGNPETYSVFGQQYNTWQSADDYSARGTASWYGTKFHERLTSSGEPYDMLAMTAAHRNLPLPSYVRVTNLDNGKQIIVKVNDRGPFHDDRIIDLSYVAAKKLDIIKHGTGNVQVDIIPIDRLDNKQFAYEDKSSGKKMFLQIGAFSQHENAERFAQTVERQLAQPVRLVPSETKKPLYLVKIGPLENHATHQVINSQLQTLGITSSPVWF